MKSQEVCKLRYELFSLPFAQRTSVRRRCQVFHGAPIQYYSQSSIRCKHLLHGLLIEQLHIYTLPSLTTMLSEYWLVRALFT